jgi:small GTP-binding protein
VRRKEGRGVVGWVDERKPNTPETQHLTIDIQHYYMSVILKKICMIGDFGVGKTSLVRHFVDRQFSDNYLSTIGVKISRKLLSVSTPEEINKQIQFMIWDLEGETASHAITPGYVNGTSGVIVVADLNRRETVERVQKHIKLVSDVNCKDVACVVALNKVDVLNKDNSGYLLESLALLQSHPQVIAVFPTSAKTGDRVDTMFDTLARTLLKPHQTQKIVQPFL